MNRHTENHTKNKQAWILQRSAYSQHMPVFSPGIALAKFYKDTPNPDTSNPAIPRLTPPCLDLGPPRLDFCLSRLTVYVLGKKWETSSSGEISSRRMEHLLLLWKVQKQRHRDRYIQNILMTLFGIRSNIIWWRTRPHSNPYVSHALGSRLCRGVVIDALREYKVARQSTSMRQIVLLK